MKKKQAANEKKKPRQPAQKDKRDSDDIERAVYDGMQDLRVKRKPGRV